MPMRERASNEGFTLLELALAVALSSALLLAFFSASRALLQGLLLSADGMRGPSEAAEAMSRIVDDVEQATSIISTSSYSIYFNTSAAGPIAYRLYAADSASQDLILERMSGGASQSIGPRRMIANFNPYGSTYFLLSGATSSDPVQLFIFRDTATNTGPMLDIQLLLQPNQTAPATFLRTIAFVYSRTTWW